MNLKRIAALAKKEFVQISRDPRSLAMAIVIPLLMIILFGSALSLDVNNVPMVIWDQDNSMVSQNFIKNFKFSKYFNIVAYFDNYKDLENYIDRGKAIMAMVIPKDFSRYLNSSAPAPLQLIVDGSDSNTATIGLGYVNSVVSKYNLDLAVKTYKKAGVTTIPVLEFRPRIWFNPDLNSRVFIIPGLIAVIMMVIAALLTSLTVAREWERGTMEQLIATPVKAGELIVGKFIPYFVIGFIDLLIAVFMAQFVFLVPLRGSLILLFILSSVFLTGVLTMGILISIGTKNQLLASQIAIISTFIPAFLLSGFMYAISNMPPVIQLITHIIPARYFITILRGIYLKGVGIEILWTQALFLIIFAFIMVAIAKLKFKKKVF